MKAGRSEGRKGADRKILRLVSSLQPFVQWPSGVFPRRTAAGAFVNHPPPSNASVKEGVELYLCALFGPTWPVLR